MAVHDTGYLGNPLLKKAGIPHQFTKYEVDEYVKCSQDPVYFVRNYVKIVNLDHGLVPFDVWPFQQQIIESVHRNRFTIAKLPRQSGKTTTVISYFLYYILFNEDVNIAILANKGSLARDILGRLQLAYENLPSFLQQGIKVWNRGDLQLENGSKIIAASTSSSAVRGGSYNMILLDEFAFVPKNIADEFFSSVYPTISSGKTTKVIIVSTPCGMNHFYKLWTDAIEKRNLYNPIEVHWSEVPGRDDAWKEETIKTTSKEQFQQEFECDFVGSVNTLISATKLKMIPFKTPISSVGSMDVYENPEPGHVYTIVVDSSHGEGLDYSAFSVMDSSEFPYKQVAKYRNASIPPMTYPTIIENAARKYNDAFVLVEVNDVGQQVADILHYDLEYDNMLTVTMRGRAGQVLGGGFGVGQPQMGVKTTKKVKQLGCMNLKSLVEGDKLLLSDFDTIAELTSFVARGNSYQADPGHNDDLVMTLVLFAWLTIQPYFKDLTDVDARARVLAEKMKDQQDDLMPFGFIANGVTSDETAVDRGDGAWLWGDDMSAPSDYDDRMAEYKNAPTSHKPH
jgi:hypothetical protein